MGVGGVSAVGSPSATGVGVGAGVLMGNGVGVGGASTDVGVGKTAALAAGGRVDVAAACPDGACSAAGGPPHAASHSDTQTNKSKGFFIVIFPLLDGWLLSAYRLETVLNR
jgi:hypothetical protein